MPDDALLDQQISLFRSRIRNRSFDDGTLQILESILISKDVESLIGVKSTIAKLMRDESLLIFREITEESVHIKLLCTDFLVRVFALIGDVESCLALRYEALIMREKYAVIHHVLRVSFEEWLTFAEHSLANGFYSIAEKTSEKALLCAEANQLTDPEAYQLVIQKIKRISDAAVLSICSQSVQAQAAVYLKQRKVEQNTQKRSNTIQSQNSATLQFRSGIKKHNLRRLHELQRL